MNSRSRIVNAKGGEQMTSDDQRAIGRLEGAVKALAEQVALNRQESRTDFGKVFSQLSAMQSNGCAIGKDNERRIKELERKPERNVAALSAVLGIIASAIAIIAYFKV